MEAQQEKGLYGKYYVNRVDGRDKAGGDKSNANYFVLDLTHDPFAVPALKAYIQACRETYAALANDLEKLVEEKTDE